MPAGVYGDVMRMLPAVLLFLLFPVLGRALESPTQEAAWQARRMLGEGVWSRVLRIENDDRHSPYPATVHALVFEMGGLLWFYTGMDGTQSFSLHRGRLEEEKREFGRLLRAVDPGFKRFTILPDTAPAWARDSAPLANGCFIDSLVALREALEQGEPVKQARLLTYYVKWRGRVTGHTVLVYTTDLGMHVVDKAAEREPQVFLGETDDGLELARRLLHPSLRHRLVTTRWFELISPSADDVGRAGWLAVLGAGSPALAG